MAEITVTLKGGPGYDAPWIVVKGESIEEIDRTLGQLSELGAFVALQTLSQEFRNAPIVSPEDALRAVQDVFPKAEVVREESAKPAAPAAPAAPPAEPVEQKTPPCEKCGQPTDYRSGNHPTSGAWEAYFCQSGDRSHTKFLGR